MKVDAQWLIALRLRDSVGMHLQTQFCTTFFVHFEVVVVAEERDVSD